MKPIMAKATAVWLIDNTGLTFKQIADFCNMHLLEIEGIADGEVAVGILGINPIENNQLDAEEIEKGEADPVYNLQLKNNPWVKGEKRRYGARYTPVSRRQDKPSAILWLVKNHPELSISQICKMIGTTKTTVEAIRSRTHWNTGNIQPVDPVTLGLCQQRALDETVNKAEELKRQHQQDINPDHGSKLTPVASILNDENDLKISSAITELQDFKLTNN